MCVSRGSGDERDARLDGLAAARREGLEVLERLRANSISEPGGPHHHAVEHESRRWRGFLASAARGALCQDITGIFSWMSVFCATARAPSVRRASRWPILLPNGLFRFVRNEEGRARARASTQSLLGIGLSF